MQDPVQTWAIFVVVLVAMVSRWAYQAGRASVLAQIEDQARAEILARHAQDTADLADRVAARDTSASGKVSVTVGGRTFDVDESLAKERR